MSAKQTVRLDDGETFELEGLTFRFQVVPDDMGGDKLADEENDDDESDDRNYISSLFEGVAT